MSEAIKDIVKKAYTEVVTKEPGNGYEPSCCSPIQTEEFREPSCCSPIQAGEFRENYSQLKGYVPDADFGLGCGIPTEFAQIKEGDTVLDLGSGAGNDVFVARSIVGENGRVIGVDMTEAMIEKAKINNQKLGFKNVEFLYGEIENLPVEDAIIDVAVSNCVMNLVPDKNKAYSEVYRVLKSQGHFSISDIVLNGELPENIRNAAAMYAGCVAGALEKSDYINAIRKAGFKNIEIVKERDFNLPDNLLLQYLSRDKLNEYRESKSAVLSITVYAEK